MALIDKFFLGFVMFAVDLSQWYRHDHMPLVTNPDAWGSTVNAPWFFRSLK